MLRMSEKFHSTSTGHCSKITEALILSAVCHILTNNIPWPFCPYCRDRKWIHILQEICQWTKAVTGHTHSLRLCKIEAHVCGYQWFIYWSLLRQLNYSPKAMAISICAFHSLSFVFMIFENSVCGKFQGHSFCYLLYHHKSSISIILCFLKSLY